MEKFTKSILESLFIEINSSGVTHDKLKPCLFSVVCTAEIASLRQLNDHKKIWNRRIDLFSRMDHTTSVSLNITDIPLDGRTIRPEHFETIWSVFDIPGPFIPSPLHKFALNDVAEGRNKVAHGEVDPITFGRSRNPADFIRIITQIEDIIIHVAESSDKYLQNKQYQR